MENVQLKGYILRETLICTLINMVFSFGFAYAFFRGADIISQGQLVGDAVPQSFFVTFFGVLVPTIMTRKKLASGVLAGLPPRSTRLPRNPALRAIAMGILAAIAGCVLHLAVLRALQIEQVTLETLFIYKPVYGALLTWLVTPFGLLVELRQERSVNE